MEEAATSEAGAMAHFPPGSAAPTAEQKLAERLAKMNAGKKAFYDLPLEERNRIIAERRRAKEQRQAEREAKRAAKAAKRNGGSPPPTSPMGSDSAPPTVRSHRAPPAPPDSDIPRRGAQEVRGLLDLCATMPHLGDGSCFIQVTRLKPPVSFGVPTAGVQRPLWDALDDAEFALTYGGAEYSLRGYALREGGKARAVTEPITYRVAGPPNLDSALTEDDAMRPNPPPQANGHPAFRRPGIVTPQAADAEARIHDRTLTHQERERDNRREERRRERQEAEEREAARRDGDLNVAKLLSEDKEREMQRLQQMQERQLELAQAQNKGGGLAELAEALKIMNPSDSRGAERHAAEIRQISESHKEEMLRLTEQHRTELQRVTESHAAALHRVEDQARAERERGEKLVRDADTRAHESVREAERRADQRVTDAQNQARGNYEELRTRSEERIRDQNDSWTRRLDDLRGNHDREMRTKESEINLMRSNLEGNMAVILAGKDSEIKRLQHDLREWKDIAEKNKDWLGKMTEFDATAERLGYAKGGEGEGAEEDLKTTVIKAGLGVAQRLPEMITAASEGIAKIRNPGVPPDLARSQARSGMVRESMRTIPRSLGVPAPVVAPLTFATEDGGYTPPPDAVAPRLQQAPIVTQPAPLPPLEQSPSVALAQQYQPQQLPLPLPEMQPPPVQPPSPAEMQAPAPPPPPAAPQSAPPEPAPTLVPAPAAPAAPSADGLDEGDLLILQRFTPMLAMHFESRVAPEDVARQIIQDNGVDLARMAIVKLSAERLIRAIAQNPGQYAVLATRNGQKFLREIWTAAEKLVAE